MLDIKIISDFIKAVSIENRHIDSFHFSSNSSLTEIILGKEGMSHPLIKKNHPAIGTNQHNESVLIDRWGTPYFIHLQHINRIEVFSAGPDKIRGNKDDLQWPLFEEK